MCSFFPRRDLNPRETLSRLNWEVDPLNPNKLFAAAFRLSKSPLGASLDELVHQQAQVGQDEAANVEGEELGSVADAEFKADVRLRRVLEARIFDLTGDLICDGERIG